MNFYKLVMKEIKGSRWTMLLFLILTVFWHLFLLAKTGKWHEETYLTLGLIPYFVLPLWVLGNMLHMIHSEWNSNTIYLLLSLPIRGWAVTGSKIVASVIELVILGLLAGISFMLFFGSNFLSYIAVHNDGVPLTWMLSPAALAAFFYILVTFICLVLAQFSYLVSRLVGRFRGLIIAATAFVLFWIFMRLGGMLSPLFEWVPDFSFKTWTSINNVINVGSETLNSAPIAAVVFLTVLVFIAGSIFYDKNIEV